MRRWPRQSRAKWSALRARVCVVTRTPLLAIPFPIAALGAALARWWHQGSNNVYTAIDKRFYVPDPDLGWNVTGNGVLWLGLEVIAAMAAVAIAVAVAAVWIRRAERARGCRRWLRIALWCVAVATIAVPVAAFASGGRPVGGVDFLPEGATAAAPTTGIEGHLAVPAGAYRVVTGQASAITARIRAGGDRFDARFAGGLTGTVRGDWGEWARDPRAFSADVSVDASSVDTGIELRSKHAREDYLDIAKHPRIGFSLGELVAARQDRPDHVAFRARGTMRLLGRDVPVEVTGAVKSLAPEAASRLGATGRPALIVTAETALSLAATPLAGDNSFDDDRVPIIVTLLLLPQI